MQDRHRSQSEGRCWESQLIVAPAGIRRERARAPHDASSSSNANLANPPNAARRRRSSDRGENAENKVAPSAASESPPESQTSDSKLRVLWCDSKLRDLWSPKLNLSEGVLDDCARADASERITASSADTAQRASGEAVARPAGDAALPRSKRRSAADRSQCSGHRRDRGQGGDGRAPVYDLGTAGVDVR
jgi:hypothetical protein